MIAFRKLNWLQTWVSNLHHWRLEKLSHILLTAKSKINFAVVLIVPPDKTMVLCFHQTSICLFESHKHGHQGGIIASSSFGNTSNFVRYLTKQWLCEIGRHSCRGQTLLYWISSEIRKTNTRNCILPVNFLCECNITVTVVLYTESLYINNMEYKMLCTYRKWCISGEVNKYHEHSVHNNILAMMIWICSALTMLLRLFHNKS